MASSVTSTTLNSAGMSPAKKKEEKFALDVLVFATLEPKRHFEVAFDIFSTLPIFCRFLKKIREKTVATDTL